MQASWRLEGEGRALLQVVNHTVGRGLCCPQWHEHLAWPYASPAPSLSSSTRLTFVLFLHLCLLPLCAPYLALFLKHFYFSVLWVFFIRIVLNIILKRRESDSWHLWLHVICLRNKLFLFWMLSSSPGFYFPCDVWRIMSFFLCVYYDSECEYSVFSSAGDCHNTSRMLLGYVVPGK